MKATSLAAFAAVILAALCAVLPAPASAQGRADIFTVAGVQVDETAANGAAAQTQGFASAQRIGFDRLARRLTTSAEQQRLGVPAPDALALDRLARSVDIENERRSGTRYIARLSVRFDPEGVRTLLRGAGFTVIEQRTAPTMVVAVAESNVSPEALAAWRAAWSEGGFAQDLVPLIVAPANAPASDWAAIAPFAQAEAAASAVIATLRIQGANATATVREVNAVGGQDRSAASAAIADSDAASLRTALNSLAQSVSAQIQDEWKARNATPTGTPVAQRGSRVSASALYANQREWERIKGALEGAASTLISQIRIEAVARDGALVSFSFVGERDQLAAELARRGVTLEDSRVGPVLRAAAQR